MKSSSEGVVTWTTGQVVLATVFVVCVFLTFWLLYRLREVLFLFFVAIVVGTAIRPAVDWLHRRGAHRCGLCRQALGRRVRGHRNRAHPYLRYRGCAPVSERTRYRCGRDCTASRRQVHECVRAGDQAGNELLRSDLL